jgi:hypothetical protein
MERYWPKLAEDWPLPCPSVLIDEDDVTKRTLKDRQDLRDLGPVEKGPTRTLPVFDATPSTESPVEERAGQWYSLGLAIDHSHFLLYYSAARN